MFQGIKQINFDNYCQPHAWLSREDSQGIPSPSLFRHSWSILTVCWQLMSTSFRTPKLLYWSYYPEQRPMLSLSISQILLSVWSGTILGNFVDELSFIHLIVFSIQSSLLLRSVAPNWFRPPSVLLPPSVTTRVLPALWLRFNHTGGNSLEILEYKMTPLECWQDSEACFSLRRNCHQCSLLMVWNLTRCDHGWWPFHLFTKDNYWGRNGSEQAFSVTLLPG